MESCLTLNPHHSTACTGNTASNFFHQDAVSEHLVTLWADLPVIYQECRQMCWKFYLGTTQISVCFANSDPEKREFSTLYSLKGCFAWPGHSPVFLRYSSQSFKQRKNLQFPTDLFLALWSPAMLSPPGQKTENPYSFSFILFFPSCWRTARTLQPALPASLNLLKLSVQESYLSEATSLCSHLTAWPQQPA